MAKKAKPLNEKIARALYAAKAASRGGALFKLGTLSRVEQNTLKAGGWVFPIYAGWYALLNPSSIKAGDTVAYFSNYWEFVQSYLTDLYGRDYALSPFNSLLLQTEDHSIPTQLFVNTSKSTYNKVPLLFDTWIFISKGNSDEIQTAQEKNGLRILSLEVCLAAMPPHFYQQTSASLDAAILTVRDIPLLSQILTNNREQTTAGRIITCFRKVGRNKDATMIERAFDAAGLQIKTEDLDSKFSSRPLVRKSAIGARLSHMWSKHSQDLDRLMDTWPAAADQRDQFLGTPFVNANHKLAAIYNSDAFHSLCIEGYTVTDELIARIGRGAFDPLNNPKDRLESDGMIALGYHDAFLLVIESLRKIHAGGDPNQIIFEDLPGWHAGLFKHSIQAHGGSTAAIIGYRNSPVYIRDSQHVPTSHHSIMDAMESFQELYATETHPFKKAVLSHHAHVFIHPYVDGNGRTARFLLNASLVAGGLPWTVIPRDKKFEYFAALETAHTGGGIEKFATFIYNLL